jgi:hypothetical protein
MLYRNINTNKLIEFIEIRDGYVWFRVDGVVDCIDVDTFDIIYELI